MFITIEPAYKNDKLEFEFWVCQSVEPEINALGETRMIALKNWEDAYKDYKHPHHITVDDLLEDVRI